MLYLSIAEIIVALHDLLDKRRSVLARLSSGNVFCKLLGDVLAQLEALPPALRGLPRSQLLKDFDQEHDRYLRVLNLIRQLLMLWPGATPAMLEASEGLDEHFVGSTDGKLPYAKEVQLASTRAAKLESFRSVFDAVPTPDGGTLTALIERYLTAARALGDNLSGRADDLAARTDASQAAALRGRAVGLVGDLRTAVRRDLEADPALPRTLEADLLGYVDELDRLASGRVKSGATVATPAPVDAAPEEPSTSN